MLKFLFGVFIGWVLFAGDCEAGNVKWTLIVPPPASECVSAPLSIAALDGLAEARRLMVRDEWEYGGAVYSDERGYVCVSHPITSQSRTRMLFSIGEVPGYTLIALYHSHPGTDAYAYVFSGTDARSACRANVPSFIVTEDRAAFRFDPQRLFCQYVEDEDPNIVPGRFVGLVQP